VEVKILNEKRNELEFSFKGERHTYLNLLKNTLLKDRDVEFVSFKLDHPEGDSGTFYIKTKGKSARNTIKNAIKAIEKELDMFENTFLGVFKEVKIK